ncbi:MAG: hypothetical protein Kow0092_12820 [Deferrisomatales bacterium]
MWSMAGSLPNKGRRNRLPRQPYSAGPESSHTSGSPGSPARDRRVGLSAQAPDSERWVARANRRRGPLGTGRFRKDTSYHDPPPRSRSFPAPGPLEAPAGAVI